MFRCLPRLSQRSAGFANHPGVAEVAQLWSMAVGGRWDGREGGGAGRRTPIGSPSFLLIPFEKRR